MSYQQSSRSRRSSSASSTDSTDLSALPFPKPLPRSAFTTAEFSSSNFLTSLRNRHQSLEDLRLELRGRSSELEKELVELVNKDYADFIGIAGSLKGGEGKIKDLTAGVMGFGREIEALQGKIAANLKTIKSALDEKQEVLKAKKLARDLIAFHDQLGRLENILLISNSTEGSGDKINSVALLLHDEEDDGGGGGGGGSGARVGTKNEGESGVGSKKKSAADSNSLTTMKRLQQIASAYLYLRYMLEKLPSSHPFALAQKGRIDKIHKTVLEDFATALKECRAGISRKEADEEEKKDYQLKLVDVLKLWADIGEEKAAVKTLKVK